MERAGAAAGITWAQMIKQEIIDIKLRLSKIEAYIAVLGLENASPETLESQRLFGEMGAGYAGYEYRDIEPKEEPTRSNLTEVLVLTMQTRRALFGYSQLLGELGLDKDQKKLLRQMESAISMILRLTQAIRMMQEIQSVGLFTPMGAVYGFLGIGVLASSLYYGSKFGGGST